MNSDFTSNELAEIRSRALGMLRKATGKSECAALKSLITSASKMQACLVQEEAQNQINEAAQMTLEDAIGGTE